MSTKDLIFRAVMGVVSIAAVVVLVTWVIQLNNENGKLYAETVTLEAKVKAAESALPTAYVSGVMDTQELYQSAMQQMADSCADEAKRTDNPFIMLVGVAFGEAADEWKLSDEDVKRMCTEYLGT